MSLLRSFLWGLVVLFLICVSAQARINVTALPKRDLVQLTIYNSVDLTLVKETRLLTFRRGLNRLEFSWANTLIDPTSVEFHALTHSDELEVLDVSFPPRVTNTLEWRIRSEFAGEVKVEIRYFTSGIRWSADYVAEANPEETAMTLTGQVRVHNQSGEDYENAQVRLVVGVIRLVEEIAKLAQPGQDRLRRLSEEGKPVLREQERLNLYFAFSKAEGAAAGRPAQIIKEGVSEYFLYTVEGRDTIPTGWSKRLPSFRAADVPLTSYYKFEKERWGDQAMRFYRFKNDPASQLGREPLPDGALQAFRLTQKDWFYAYVGRTAVKYIPIQEQVDLELGADAEVMVKPVLINWQKTDLRFDANGEVRGWTTKETWQLELQNSKAINITVDLRRRFAGDWSLSTEAPYETVDAHTIKFVRPLKPGETHRLTYEVITRHGTNATR